MSEGRHQEAVHAAIALLVKRFPACFAMYEARRRPLKIGIRSDIAATLDGAITPHDLANALRVYCGNRGYLASTRTGAARIDLAGKPVGVVTEQESQSAKERLIARKARPPAKPTQPKAPQPKRLSLADLKAAAAARRKAVAA